MKLLLTGGTGFLGQYLLKSIADDTEYEVICLSGRNNFDNLITGRNIQYIPMDSEDINTYFSWAESFIHLAAAIPSYGKISEDDYMEVSIDNIQTSIKFLGLCRDNGINNIVIASSIAVYGNEGTEPYFESQKEEANTIYGAYKLAIEKYARYFHTAYKMNIKCLRIAQVYGARKNIRNPFLRMCADNSIKHIPITVFDTGETAMDYVYVKDVCRALLLAVNKPELTGEFNVGAGRAISSNEMAQAHADGFGGFSPIVHIANGKEKMVHRSMDLTKSRELLGYVPIYTVLDACKDMANEYATPEWLPN